MLALIKEVYALEAALARSLSPGLSREVSIDGPSRLCNKSRRLLCIGLVSFH